MKKLIIREFEGWKTWEILWLFFACAIITGLSIYWQDTPMGIVSATTGVACVICTGKGKLSAYLFGLINSVLYAIIAYKAHLYGETMLNVIYYVPMQFLGFYTWNKHMDDSTTEVEKRKMKNHQKAILVIGIVTATVAYGFILKFMGDAMPFVDSFTTVSSVFAMIISIKMFSEQWHIWIAVDVMTVIMWTVTYIKEGIDYLVNEEEKLDMNVTKEAIDVERYRVKGKKINREQVVIDKFAGAKIVCLIASKVPTKTERIVDNVIGFLTDAPFGIPEFLNEMELYKTSYYVVEKDRMQFLVSVSDEFIETRRMVNEVNTKKFQIGELKFKAWKEI